MRIAQESGTGEQFPQRGTGGRCRATSPQKPYHFQLDPPPPGSLTPTHNKQTRTQTAHAHGRSTHCMQQPHSNHRDTHTACTHAHAHTHLQDGGHELLHEPLVLQQRGPEGVHQVDDEALDVGAVMVLIRHDHHVPIPQALPHLLHRLVPARRTKERGVDSCSH